MPKRPPTAIHVSWLTREAGHGGGVEKFAMYLRMALVDKGWQVGIMGWHDFPSWKKYDRTLPNPEKAALLGAWLDGPQFGYAYDVAVSDGYWGIGITSKPVVPVVHGTWAEFHVRMGLSPTLEVQRQGEAFQAPNAFPVACSPASAREVRRHHGRSITTITHGIDLSLYRPREEPLPPGPPWIVLEAAGGNEKKGARLMPHIARLLGPDYRIEYLAAEIGQEPEAFRRGHLFLHPTRHEGNAYACLEALATDLPIVTTEAGLFEDVARAADALAPTTRTEIGYTLPITSTPEAFAQAVRATVGRIQAGEWRGRPRAWAEANANMTNFAGAWDGLLRQIIGREQDHA